MNEPDNNRVILFGFLRVRGEELDEPRKVVLIPRREYFIRKEDNELTNIPQLDDHASETTNLGRGRTMGERDILHIPRIQNRQYQS